MVKGLVSILSPCYNKGKMISRFLDSVLAQTYKNIELIIVNDGSSDESLEILKSYNKAFEEKNIKYEIINQENAGVSAAINNGLKRINGEFFCWPDIDDWLVNDSIEKKVNFLNKYKKFGIVSSDAYVYNEDDLLNPIMNLADKNKIHFKQKQFYPLLKGCSLASSGCHMIRTEALFDSIKSKEIYPSRYGQNIQILLPVYYKYLRGYINEPLYNYVIYKGSLSHSSDSYEKSIDEREGRFKARLKTLERIEMPDKKRERCIKTLFVTEARLRMKVAKKYMRPELAEKQIEILKKFKSCKIKDRIEYKKIINNVD